MIAATSESTSSPIPALIARRRRTTVGVGILMTFAGPLRVPGGRRRVAGLPLISGSQRTRNSTALVVGRGGIHNSTANINHSLSVSSYLAISRKSTRTILASAALLCMLSVRTSFAADSASALPAGALKSAPSMYLREASSSAIRWQPWNPQTLALARKLNRPIMIDIGAVWCHWCHVMDETTYSDPQVAAALNSEFVPVKVDTDERPDLDDYYQNAAAQLTGAGGWPLTCFTTPDGALIFAAGYLPPRPGSGPGGSGGESTSMLPLLARISQVYATDRASLEREAEATAEKLKSALSQGAPAQGGLDGLRA